MSNAQPSALITDNGQKILLRIQGKFYELSQEELRTLLDLPPDPPGLGITIDRGSLRFEFPADNQTVEMTAERLQRRLAKQLT
ncbi:MAG TPA: hypothetical protein VGY66_05710 [Gemmataceae bacterium]|jgi:hypothetical protein|nr:hypothetical protein [Gemmataceae bacterium]